MSNATIAGVAIWVALVMTPIFLQPSGPSGPEEAVLAVVDAHRDAVERGDGDAVGATLVGGATGVRIESDGATVPGSALDVALGLSGSGARIRIHSSALNLSGLHVATVTGSWGPGGQGNEDGEAGVLTLVLEEHHGRWAVSHITVIEGVG